MNSKKPEWEYFEGMMRIKVDGGYLYRDINQNAMCFVPDIDLSRYQSHLRDAYKKGYTEGQEDARNNEKVEDGVIKPYSD